MGAFRNVHVEVSDFIKRWKVIIDFSIEKKTNKQNRSSPGEYQIWCLFFFDPHTPLINWWTMSIVFVRRLMREYVVHDIIFNRLEFQWKRVFGEWTDQSVSERKLHYI